MPQRKVILSMSITLDGYVAAPDNKMDWMKSTPDEWNDLFKDLDEADTFLLGRKMYPEYSAHWQEVLKNPSADADEMRFAKLAEKTQHIVFTKQDFIPDWKNTKVAHDVETDIVSLKKQPGKNIIAWGGANFAAYLIKFGLVDEIRFALQQAILGKGKNLYETVDERSNLELIDAKTMKSGVVVLRYKKL